MDTATLRSAMQETYIADSVLAEYLPHFEEAMRAAQINTVRRAAAWCSQIGHESAGLRYMAEIETSNPSWSWDRTRYRGRGPIQLTWQDNYRKFGIWCRKAGYIDDPELFVNKPELVEQPRWGFLAASWYWLKGGPRPGQINAFADAGDILGVSRCVNGWVPTPNGMPDRQARYNRALELGTALLPQEDDMANAAEKIEEQLLGRKEADGERRGWPQLGDHEGAKRSLVDGVARVIFQNNFAIEQNDRIEKKLDAFFAANGIANPAPRPKGAGE